jgi:hypothetical protein
MLHGMFETRVERILYAHDELVSLAERHHTSEERGTITVWLRRV